MWSHGYCRGDRVTMGAGPVDIAGGIGSPWGLLYVVPRILQGDRVTMGGWSHGHCRRDRVTMGGWSRGHCRGDRVTMGAVWIL